MTTAKINLYAFPKPFNAPSASGFCQKVETFLRACPSLAESYKHIRTYQKSPKGKLPWITVTPSPTNATPAPPPVVVADSHFIVQHLIKNYGAEDLDADLTPAQRADSRAYQAWTENVMYPALACTRWMSEYWPHNYLERYKLISVHWLIKPIAMFFVRRNACKSLRAQGPGAHSKEEIETLIREWVDGVSAKIGDGESWFHGGENPTNVDVILAAFLMQVAHPDHREFVGMVEEKKGLIVYTIRAVKKWFPEYEGLLRKLERMRVSELPSA